MGDRTGDDGLELVVLGAGPAYSDLPGSVGAGYLVRCDQATVLMDLGQGAFSTLAREVEPSTLAAVLISHLHPDHFIDLIPLRHYLCRAEFQPSRRLRLLAPAGLDGRLDAVYDQPGFFASAFDREEPPDLAIGVGPFQVRSVRVRHAGESRAWRVALRTGGPGIVYTGDAADADELAPLVVAGDLLLAEATFGAGPVPPGMPHLDGPMVGDLAARTGVGGVVVTHIRMGCDLQATIDAVRARFAGPVVLARPGIRVPVGVVVPGAPP